MIVIKNQQLANIQSTYTYDIDKEFDLKELLTEHISDKFYQKRNPNHPLVLKNNNIDIKPNDITNEIINSLDKHINPNSEKILNELFSKTLIHYTPNETIVKKLILNQNATEHNMVFPSLKVKYTEKRDIIPSCRKHLNQSIDPKELSTTFAFYKSLNTLGFMFTDEFAFDEFKEHLKNIITANSTHISISDAQLASDFQSLTLDKLTESITIRTTINERNEPYSFARILTFALMDFSNNNSDNCFPIIYDLSEFFIPTSLVFVNIEQHAYASATSIKKEWDTIETALNNPIKMISKNKLQKLTSVATNIRNAKSRLNQANAMCNQSHELAKRKSFKFSKNTPSNKDIAKRLMLILNHMKTVNKSQNAMKTVKNTYQKPSRRNPDDFNKPGKTISKIYKPDIHLYVDTSGSISEINYQDAIKTCIKIAKKLNVNLYFNSFSHVLSPEYLIKTKDKSVIQCYKEFQKIDKVTGGTEFDLVYNYINKSPVRKRRLSIMITDFGWTARHDTPFHPPNLYYAPCSNMDYDCIKYDADSFCNSMYLFDKNIRKRLIF